MDDMDRLLARLASEQPPYGLATRFRNDFHQRYRRYRFVQISISSVMVVTGAWLFFPWILALVGGLNLHLDGISLLQSLASDLNTGSIVNATWQNANLMQTSLSDSIGLFPWLGLVSLGAGSLIGLSALLPGNNVG